MERLAAVITALILLVHVQASMSTGADSHANKAAPGSAEVAAEHTAAHVQRRYVPQFIGKRKAVAEDTEQAVLEDTGPSLEESINELEEVGDLKHFYKNLLDLSEDSSVGKGDETGDIAEESDLNSFELEDLSQDESASQEIERRNAPYFIGKRYTPRFVGKRHIPSFVGKRFTPLLINERYTPSFVGKRFAPQFVGKRYTPSFVGKRYTPSFVGKRYTPSFVGKRYTPSFVGKRYTPSFVGKRYTPAFVGKRYTPSFVGKREGPIEVEARYTPSFVGKRYTPAFVGKRVIQVPEFVGKKPSDMEMSGDRSVLEKREATHETEEAAHISSRRKRSVFDDGETGLAYKRAWGRYVPWKGMPSFDVFHAAPSKRFVAPEFVGRRDSISSLLNALKVLNYARNEPRLASKRFEAPLFIGKRSTLNPASNFMDNLDAYTGQYQQL